ncbi:MAG: hypothetical protein FWE49_03790 [Synergistaceae bacterium]|nr:hypothetical protein [Synergistaceae bacterium]
MIELIVTAAILSLLAVLVLSRVSWIEPNKRILQRAFIEAGEIAKSGTSIRFRVDNEENRGAFVSEVLVKDEKKEVWEKGAVTWKAVDMRWRPDGKEWVFKPEIIYFFQDGMCTPARITWGTHPNVENYLLTVTGYLVEHK